MNQVPDVNATDSFYLGTGVLPGGATTTSESVANNQYENFISADSLSGGSVLNGKEAAQNAPIAADKYQASVQAAIDAFITSLINGTQSNINVIANVVNAAVGSAVVPNSTAITNQYNADAALIAAAADQVNGYNDYVTSLSSGNFSTSLSSIQSDITSGNDLINGSGSTQSVTTQLSDDITQYNTDVNNGDYTEAATVLQNALSLYNTNVVSNFSTLSTNITNYNALVIPFYSNNPLDSGYSQTAWNAAQAAITTRNNNTDLTKFYGTLQNIPSFSGVTTLDSLGTAPPDGSTFGLPTTVSASTDNAAVVADLSAMISAASTAEGQISTLNTVSTANTSGVVNAAALPVPTIVSSDQYFQNVTNQVETFLTSSTFQALLGLLGVQNNASAQALIATLLSVQQGSATILLSNPSGGAVTGATLSSVADSAFLKAFAQALAQELLREVESGQAFQPPSGAGIRAINSGAQDPTAMPTSVTAESSSSLTNAPTNPGSTDGSTPGNASATGILANIPALSSDFSALLGQYAVLAAVSVLQSDSNISSLDTQTGQSEFLASVSNLLSGISSSDLDNRITSILQAQGVTLSQANLEAINNTAVQFTTALQGIIANTISGQSNLATSTLAAQIASNFVQTTFQAAQQTSNNQQVKLTDEENSDAQLQILLQNLPQEAFLSGPAGLAQQAEANGGAGQNGSLGLSLAAVLPKDANGNFESVTPTQLYNDLVSIQGQATGSATFYQFIQNEPSYQLDEVTSSNANRGKAGKLNQQLQLNQQSTLAATANKNYTNSLAQLSSQFDAETLAYQTQSNLINNPTLTAYYEKKLLPGKNLLNIGIQATTDQFANTPSAKNTTQFPV